jgi:hypothetical protein
MDTVTERVQGIEYTLREIAEQGLELASPALSKRRPSSGE